MSVLMSQNVSNTSLIKDYIQTLINKNVTVYPPNINESTTEFKPYKDGMLSPLTLIKGVGHAITQKNH